MTTEKEAPPAGEGIAYDDRFCAICGSARHDWRSFVIGEGDSARICDSCLHDLGCDIEWRERAEKAESDLHREAERRAEVERERDRQRVALDKINVIRNSIVSIQGFNFSEHAYPLVAALNEAGIEGKPYPADREYLGSLIDQRDAAIAERDDARQQLASLASAARELVAALPHCTAVLDAANTVCGKPGLRRERVDIGFEDRCDEHLEGPYFSNGYSSELKRLLSQLSALDSAGGEGETNSPKNWESSK